MHPSATTRSGGVRRFGFPVAVIILLPMLVGCVTEPITGRWMFNVLPDDQANAMGTQAYDQMLGEAKLSADAAWNDRVRRVGERIAAVVDRRMAEEGREPFQWEFKVVDAPDTVNAFALPGGKVAFYTGILPICRDEAGIAVVMGHEIGHAYGRHGAARVSQTAVAQFGLSAVQEALGGEDASAVSNLAVAALGVGYQVGVQLPFSRGDESGADHIGLIVMAEAGYDPREATRFWGRMDELSGGNAPSEFFSTHPSHPTRIAQLEELMPEAIEIYERSAR